jgi:DNA-binding CsgD family transcriptional regulator
VPSGEVERTLRILNIIGPHLHESYRRVLAAHPNSANPLALVTREPVALVTPPELATLESAGSGIKLATQQQVELSAREREVLCWAQQGKTYWEIGSILGITERTVKFHMARIKAKLEVVSTAHAIAKAMRAGLIT